jgi:hypothetical protein
MKRKEKVKTVPANLFPVQFRNVNVGVFSGPRASYQRYSASPAASDVIKKVKQNGWI